MRLNKERIRLRFTRAAATYDSQAVIQLQVADKLLALLLEHVPQPPGRVLEIGCCTGLLTERLYKVYRGMETLYVNDLVPDFKTLVMDRLENDSRLTYLPGDIEHIDIPDNLDLIISSSTFHWLEDLPLLFQKVDTSLAREGSICFSIYGPGNLAEIREVAGIGLKYLSLAELQALVGNYFDILAIEEEKLTLHFADPLTMLNHLRETGVNALDTEPWTRSQLDSFAREYTELFGSEGQIPLTYNPIFCIARKKS